LYQNSVRICNFALMPTNYLPGITRQDVQDFIFSHEGEDESQFVLRQKEVFGLSAAKIAQQLAGRRKSKLKLPTWYKTKGIVYPPSVNLEQSSSEATALYKSIISRSIFSNKNDLVAVDLTGGFGIDSFCFSQVFKSTHYVEPNKDLFEIAQHNHQILGARSIIHHNTSAEEFINSNLPVDIAFLDPSRRDQQSRKVFKLADCSPDISALQDKIFKTSNFLLVKTSPLLDIQQGLREIFHVKMVFVVSVDNECKELLFLAEKGYSGEVGIEAVDLTRQGGIQSAFPFSLEEEKCATVQLGEPLEFIYEPNSALLKSGAFKLISQKFKLFKLAPNTHLYTSGELVRDFPGKVFRIEVLDPDSKILEKLLPNRQVNVITRNYPLKAEELKKKLKLLDGGNNFLIGFSTKQKKHLALCSCVIRN
jgi:16S rRNA G966 N2-methylase RsmD